MVRHGDIHIERATNISPADFTVVSTKIAYFPAKFRYNFTITDDFPEYVIHVDHNGFLGIRIYNHTVRPMILMAGEYIGNISITLI